MVRDKSQVFLLLLHILSNWCSTHSLLAMNDSSMSIISFCLYTFEMKRNVWCPQRMWLNHRPPKPKTTYEIKHLLDQLCQIIISFFSHQRKDLVRKAFACHTTLFRWLTNANSPLSQLNYHYYISSSEISWSDMQFVIICSPLGSIS